MKKPGPASIHLSIFLSLVLSLVMVVVTGCAHHTRLELTRADDPGASSSYVCRTTGVAVDGSIEGTCTPDTVVDEARWNPSNTTPLILALCPNGVRRVLVGGDDTLVECAAAQGDDGDVPYPTAGGAVANEGGE
jgi:hypothetical protein